jgi:hypothetical protein
VRVKGELSMQSVSAIHTAVNNPSIEDVCKWHTAKAQRGEVALVTVRLRVTALNSLTSILGPEEPRDADWLLNNLEDVANRWATKTQANAATARTYMGRAKGALSDFLSWRKEPTKFRFKPSTERPKRDKGKTKMEGAAAEQTPTASPPESDVVPTPEMPRPAVGEASAAEGAERRSFPLPNRSRFVFELPIDGLTVYDVKRVACHLLTLATDFDPATPSHAEVFSIVNRRND